MAVYVSYMDITLLAEFWGKVEKRGPAECWPWLAGVSSNGYGMFNKYRPRVSLLAHRIAYESTIGPIPKGLVIDHLCDNKLCVNPAHLRVTTHRDNILRGTGQSARNARKTHCSNGHPLSGDNLWIRPSRGTRICKICKAAKWRLDYARHAVARRLKGKLRQRKWRASH